MTSLLIACGCVIAVGAVVLGAVWSINALDRILARFADGFGLDTPPTQGRRHD